MSKIKDIKLKNQTITIYLESGISISKKILINQNEIDKIKNKIQNIEIFDQKSIDQKLKEISNDRNIIFNISKLILKLAAQEANASIDEYIGSKEKNSNGKILLINIEDYLTITDIIEKVQDNKRKYHVILTGKDKIVEDLKKGLRI